jgi:ketol-acid reductoisomerase
VPSVTPPALRIYRAADAEPDALAGERVVVLGYGHLGRSIALNLRDTGIPLTIGNRDDEYVATARADGFTVTSIGDAVAAGDVVFVLLPDEVIPEVFRRDIAPALRPGRAIAFASGYAMAFELVEVPAGVDVLLVAPRMGGEVARERFTAGRGFWAYIGVEADCSGRARRRMLGLAAGIGALRSGAIEMSATMEATVDLFVEQTVGPLLGAALMTAFDVGVAAGVPPEVMVMEMYMSSEMETVFRGFREAGLFPSSEAHGASALFGGLTRSLEIDREALRDRFQAVLEDIRNGGFAKRFQQEAGQGYPMVETARQMIAQPMPITEAERALRRRIETGDPPPA